MSEKHCDTCKCGVERKPRGYVIEATWNGYRSGQERVVHRELIHPRYFQAANGIGAISFSDNSCMEISVRPKKFREKIVKVNGYPEAIWGAINKGLTGWVPIDEACRKVEYKL